MKKVNIYFDCLESLDPDLVYDLTRGVWASPDECIGPYSPFSDGKGGRVRTFQAAKAHVRRHVEIPKGTKFCVHNRYAGLDRHITK